jgi:DNA-directed RNA polymerase subunit RPC12/RpoP
VKGADMTKYYCDRCGKESAKLEEVNVPTERRHCVSGSMELSVCIDCWRDYQKILDALKDIRLTMFNNFFKGVSEDVDN